MSKQFIDVKVIGCDIKSEVYMARDPAVPRGHPEYIMSRGELHDFSENPQKWLLGIPKKDTSATSWGTLMDVLVLTPERFRLDYVIQPATYESKSLKCPQCGSSTEKLICNKCKCNREEVVEQKDWNNNSTTCSEWCEAQKKAGKLIAKQDDVDEAYKAMAMLKKDARLTDLIQCSKKQMMIVAAYVDRETGIKVPLKILLDLVPDSKHPKFGKSLGDFKTARCAVFRAWDSAVDEHWYDAQGALYSDLYRAAFPDEERIEWRFAIQENEAPYVTARRVLSAEHEAIGRGKYLSALKDYCVCLATGVWPSYDDVETPNSIDGWTMTEPKEWMISAAYGLGLKPPPKPEEKKEESFDTN